MSDPASFFGGDGLLLQSLERGFHDLLEWECVGGEAFAYVAFDGLDINARRLEVATDQDARLLDQCLCECEGHGLLWREDACLLYVARKLKSRPQPWAYSESDHINELYDAIGAA